VHNVLTDALRVVRDEGHLLLPRGVRGAVHAVASGASKAADLGRGWRREAAGGFVQEDADGVLLHAQRVVVVAAVTRDPALACFVVEVPVATTASRLAAQVVVARFFLSVAEGVVVPDVLLGAAALGGAAAHAACFGHAGEDLA